MKIIIQQTGRELYVKRIDIVETGRGYLEGLEEKIFESIKGRQNLELPREYGQHRPIVIDDTDLTTLDGFRVFVDMVSFRPTINQNFSGQSLLGYVFYCNTGVTIEKIHNQIINSIDWDNHAINLSYDDW